MLYFVFSRGLNHFGALLHLAGGGEGNDIQKQTRTYKKISGCEIKADIYRLPGDGSRPAVVWIHGGGLIAGSRNLLGDKPSRTQLRRYLSSGFTVISIDYRLAPETRIEGILQDLRDMYSWLLMRGSTDLSVDTARVAFVGHSAGGYLALMAGAVLNPRPKALVSFYGYGDLTGEWITRPDSHYAAMTPVSRAEALGAVGTAAIAESPFPTKRYQFYRYVRQQGLWTHEVTGIDPLKEPQKLARFSPAMLVSSDYPPTLLLHGDADTDVPYEQSRQMAEALARQGVEHTLITLRGRDHGFDALINDDQTVSEAFESVLVFLGDRLAVPGKR